jgi:AAA family ATPase
MPLRIGWQGQRRVFRVDRFTTSCPQLFKVSAGTKIIIVKPGTEHQTHNSFEIETNGLEALSGQIEEINRVLRDYGPQSPSIELPIWHRPVQGILIYGPKGTGKSLLVERIADCAWTQIIRLSVDDLVSPTAADVFNTAGEPCLCILADLESIAPSSSKSNQSVRIRQLFDSIRDTQALIVAEARHPNNVDESLRAIRRFGSEIEISVPNGIERHQILRSIRDISDQPGDDLLDYIAARTHGYVGADLSALLQVTLKIARDRQEKLMEVTRSLNDAGIGELEFDKKRSYEDDEKRPYEDDEKRPILQPERSHSVRPNVSSGTNSPKSLEHLTIVSEDITKALSRVRPSAMQEIFLETPNVRWSDIGGQHEIKERLQLAIEEPLKMADTMMRFNLKPEKGVLLYGPPGCSKTMLVKALAAEAGLNFLAVKGAEIVSMYVGESERSIREIFRKARAASPSIIFFDEFDAIASNRRSELKVLETLLNEMDGFEELRNVFIVAATNKPEAIDPALLRPGRFDNIVYVGLPDLETRKGIIQLWFDKSVVVVDEWDLVDADDTTAAGALAGMTDGYSGAEIVNICQNAGRFAMRGKRDHIAWADLVKALQEQPHGVSKDMLERYERWGKDRR